MGANIIDYIASFVILLGLLTFTVTTTTQTLDNIYNYHSSQQMNTKATNLLNDLTESTGFPEDWAQTVTTPSSIGFRWAIGEGSYINPFAPMRMMTSTTTQTLGPFNYNDLSTASLSPWPNANLNFKVDDAITYDEASKLLNTNSSYGWRVTYTPALNVTITPNTLSTIPWYPGWGYRLALTIDHTTVPATITNYPLLIDLTQVSIAANARSDGADILFTSYDKITKIPHEIDSYDSTTGHLAAWVKIPQLSATVDTIIYIYYDNPTASNQESPGLVWSGYYLVSHMTDNPDSSHITDSSPNLLTVTKSGDSEPTQTNGVISVAQNFDGSNDYVTLNQASLTGGTDVYEMWLKSVQSSSPQTILTSGVKNNTQGFIDLVRPASSDDIAFDYAANSNWLSRTNGLSDGVNVKCIAIFNGKIYGGTSNGGLFEWDGTSNVWVQRATQLNVQTDIVSLNVFNGKLYGGTSPGGRLFEWTTGAVVWTERAPQLGSETSINSLAVYDPGSGNKLYGGTSPGGKLYEWDSVNNKWVQRAPLLKIKSLILFNSKIYGGTDDGRLLEWDAINQVWLQAAVQFGTETSINTLVVYNPGSGSNIYAGTSPNGKLYQWDSIARAWIQKADKGSLTFTDIISMIVFNGKIYAGTNPGAYLCSWISSQTSWTQEQSAAGETSLTSLTTGGLQSVSSFNFAANSGVWNNPINAATSNNVYSAPNTILTNSPSQNSGTWTNRANAYADDSNRATTSTNNAQSIYYGYGFAVPAGATIDKVRVRLDAFASTANQQIKLEISTDGGSTWRPTTSTTTVTTSEVTYWIDVTSWDSWTPAKLNTNFIRTRVTFIRTSGTLSLDWIPVEVIYSTQPMTHTLSQFNINLSGSTITKVEVGIEGYTAIAGNGRLSFTVSWDSGVSWAAVQAYSLPGSDPNTSTYLDFTSATVWTATMLNNANFQVRATYTYNGAASAGYIDQISVRVTSTSTSLYASSSPHTYLYSLSPVNIWTRVIGTSYNYPTDNSILSLVNNANYIYGCASSSGNLVRWDISVGGTVWIKAADPPASQKPITLLSNGGILYGGTSPNGYLYTFNGASWTSIVTTQYGCETSVSSMALDSGGNLKAGTDVNGLLLGVSGSSWTKNADMLITGENGILSLAVFDAGSGNKLYGGTYPGGKLFEWNGVTTWAVKASSFNGQTGINSLYVFNPGSGNILYGGTSPGGRLFEWNKVNAWLEKAPQLNAETTINSLTVFNPGSGSMLFGGTSPGGRLYQWNGADAWTERVTQLGSETSLYSLAVFDPGSGNKLYGSTGPSGELVEWDNVNHWAQRASSSLIQSMTTFNSNIYCGTSTGRLFVWNSIALRWDMKADALGSSTINVLAVFNGKIYGGTADGRLLEWDGVSAWTLRAPQLSGESITSLAVFNSKLYGGTNPSGRLFEWTTGASVWTPRANQLNSQTSINSLTVFNAKLYGGTSPGGRLFEWTTGASVWTERAPQSGSETTINALASFNNKLYGGTSPGGRLFEWDNVNNVWIGKTFILGAETSVVSLMAYNGRLYGGTSPSGLLYEWDGATKWVKMANTLNGQISIPVLSVFNNKLYGITQNGGYLYEFSDSGPRTVSNFFTGYSNSWVHLVAIANYAAGRVDLYRNGALFGSLTSASMIAPTSGPKYIGAYVVAGTAVNPYAGAIDELRISNANQDANWINLSYNNELNPSNFITVSPNESIFFRVNVAVDSRNGPVNDATVSGTLIYCIPGATAPSYAQLQSQSETTDSAGAATLDFRGYTSTIGVYFILVRANHAGIENVGYYMSSPLPKPDPVGVFVTKYENGTLTLVHRKDIDIHYPSSDVIGYNTTFAMPVGVNSYRSVSLGSAGQISPGNHTGTLQLGAAKENPGVLLTFLKTASNTYGMTFTPWGVSSLNLKATFGAPIMDATNVITKTRMVNIESYTYEVQVQIWKIGK